MLQCRRRIRVTGGAGFQDSPWGQRRLARRNTLICADNYYAGTDDVLASAMAKLRLERIDHRVTFPFRMETSETVRAGTETRIAAA